MSLARDVTTVGGGTLVSRLLGYIRDAGIAALLGTGPVSDAFFAVLQVVNFFRRLLAEGALNAAFVPIWLGLRGGDDGAANADKFTLRSLLAIFCLTGVVALLIVVFASGVDRHDRARVRRRASQCRCVFSDDRRALCRAGRTRRRTGRCPQCREPGRRRRAQHHRVQPGDAAGAGLGLRRQRAARRRHLAGHRRGRRRADATRHHLRGLAGHRPTLAARQVARARPHADAVHARRARPARRRHSATQADRGGGDRVVIAGRGVVAVLRQPPVRIAARHCLHRHRRGDRAAHRRQPARRRRP